MHTQLTNTESHTHADTHTTHTNSFSLTLSVTPLPPPHLCTSRPGTQASSRVSNSVPIPLQLSPSTRCSSGSGGCGLPLHNPWKIHSSFQTAGPHQHPVPQGCRLDCCPQGLLSTRLSLPFTFRKNLIAYTSIPHTGHGARIGPLAATTLCVPSMGPQGPGWTHSVRESAICPPAPS